MNTTVIGNTLKELGFDEGNNVETILVSMNTDGSYNAAPMGVRYVDGFIEVSPYKTSTTYENLHRGIKAALNITDDPLLFLHTAFKNELKWSNKITDWTLEGAYAAILLEKQYEYPLSNLQVRFKLNPTEFYHHSKLPRVFSRGRSEAIEAIIHATRIKVFHSEGLEEKTRELLCKLENCFSVISRVSSSGSLEVQVVKTLTKLLQSWGIHR